MTLGTVIVESLEQLFPFLGLKHGNDIDIPVGLFVVAVLCLVAFGAKHTQVGVVIV